MSAIRMKRNKNFFDSNLSYNEITLFKSQPICLIFYYFFNKKDHEDDEAKKYFPFN